MAGLEIRDPIHGLIGREEHEQEIIDAPVFQRLRRIKQLAMASLVYPGAVHTRFDHSLGVLHIAGRMAKQLLSDPGERRLVRVAALLHDIGHGPFSHVSEEILERFTERDKLNRPEGQQIHEAIGAQIIATDPALDRPLSGKERERVSGLMSGSYGDRILREMISGPVDADKQDYLLRDSYYCGVKYGVYDIERLVHSLEAQADPADRYLAISRDNVHVFEQFIMAWYYMTTQVYHHRVRLATDAMIVRGVTLGIEQDGIGWLRRLYTYDGSPDYIREYVQWHDERLVTEILRDTTADGYAKEIFRRLAERRLLKRIASFSPSDFADVPSEARDRLLEPSLALLAEFEAQVAAQYGFDPRMVIVRPDGLDPITKRAGRIMVTTPGKPRFLDSESVLFRSIDAAANQEYYLNVYAPVQYANRRDKKRKQEQFQAEIPDLLARAAGPQQPPVGDQGGQP
jgi:hypothetical protein